MNGNADNNDDNGCDMTYQVYTPVSKSILRMVYNSLRNVYISFQKLF